MIDSEQSILRTALAPPKDPTNPIGVPINMEVENEHLENNDDDDINDSSNSVAHVSKLEVIKYLNDKGIKPTSKVYKKIFADYLSKKLSLTHKEIYSTADELVNRIKRFYKQCDCNYERMIEEREHIFQKPILIKQYKRYEKKIKFPKNEKPAKDYIDKCLNVILNYFVNQGLEIKAEVIKAVFYQPLSLSVRIKQTVIDDFYPELEDNGDLLNDYR